jgi:short-subunit dehydrogenase
MYKQSEIRDQIVVNCFPIVLLTKAILPAMLRRGRRSGIINLSSVAGTEHIPFMGPYSASKVYKKCVN